jgi:hypothetical protein
MIKIWATVKQIINKDNFSNKLQFKKINRINYKNNKVNKKNNNNKNN